ncbi:hypothetical protein [Kitasatospora sp. NPDC059160]|uniref:hypothetical protein n=1 Tax=Kitasatospora sp. NPDC059160 TaxID=3346748 RepID=UPI00368E84DD
MMTHRITEPYARSVHGTQAHEEITGLSCAALAAQAARNSYVAALLARNPAASDTERAKLHTEAASFAASAEALAAAARVESGLGGTDQVAAGINRLADLIEDENADTNATIATGTAQREGAKACEEQAEDQALDVLFDAGPDGVTDTDFADLLATRGLEVPRRLRQQWLHNWSRHDGLNAVSRHTPSGLAIFVHAAHAAARGTRD